MQHNSYLVLGEKNIYIAKALLKVVDKENFFIFAKGNNVKDFIAWILFFFALYRPKRIKSNVYRLAFLYPLIYLGERQEFECSASKE